MSTEIGNYLNPFKIKMQNGGIVDNNKNQIKIIRMQIKIVIQIRESSS